jgi:hypothetical protein
MKARRSSNAVVTRAIPSGRNAGDSESGRNGGSELRGTESSPNPEPSWHVSRPTRTTRCWPPPSASPSLPEERVDVAARPGTRGGCSSAGEHTAAERLLAVPTEAGAPRVTDASRRRLHGRAQPRWERDSERDARAIPFPDSSGCGLQNRGSQDRADRHLREPQGRRALRSADSRSSDLSGPWRDHGGLHFLHGYDRARTGQSEGWVRPWRPHHRSDSDQASVFGSAVAVMSGPSALRSTWRSDPSRRACRRLLCDATGKAISSIAGAAGPRQAARDRAPDPAATAADDQGIASG